MAKKEGSAPETAVAVEEGFKPAKVIGECPKDFRDAIADAAGKTGEKEVTIVAVGKNSVVYHGATIGMKKYPQAE